MGVRLVWVASGCRHKGFATELVEEGRKRTIYGPIIPKAKVAFSQPTTEGLAFARAYVDPAVDIFVYT